MFHKFTLFYCLSYVLDRIRRALFTGSLKRSNGAVAAEVSRRQSFRGKSLWTRPIFTPSRCQRRLSRRLL
jgi:hypothetical protein